MSDNLYAPPQAELDGTARREPSDDDGDLDKAMTGASRLQAFEVLRKAADWLDGMKLTTLAIFILVSSAYGAVMVGLFLLFGARVGLGLEDFGVPGVFEHKMAQLSADPLYLVGAPLLAAPLNAWLYLVFWNVGLSRVAGHEVGLGHAFPMRVVPRAAVVMMVYSPLGLLNLIHPAASLATVPVSMVVFWMLPCFLDRDMSVADALQASLRLVQYNWLSMLGLALATLIFYVLATLTCGIGFFWFLPWSCVVLGESWRQLCGFQDMR